jgi:hypothetical protein
MATLLTRIGRFCLLKLRRHPGAEAAGVDPHSPAYLYLVQQGKRLSLGATIGRLRPRNVLLLPILLPVLLVKLADLWVATVVIRALINEHDLLERSRKSDGQGP